MIAFALGRASAEIQAKQTGFADPFAIKEASLSHTQHSQYQSITDQFERWNRELMNLPPRCCYVKAQEKAAVRITSLKVSEPTVAPTELAAVLLEYKRRYQRSKQQAKGALQGVADALSFRTGFASSKVATAAVSDAAQAAADDAENATDLFHNPFTKLPGRRRKNQ
jgi:hypothetical protein